MSSVAVLEVLWRLSLALTCPLCQNLLSRPSTLPCAHHICRTCLREYSNSSSAVSASASASGECVCPVDGCMRPFWSRECRSDNNQLHNIAQAFTQMRDAILAANTPAVTAAADKSSHSQWPNQTSTAQTANHTSDDDSDGNTTTTQYTTRRGGRTHTQRQRQEQGQGQTRGRRGWGAADDLRATSAHDSREEEEEEAAERQQDEKEVAEDEGERLGEIEVDWISGSDELIGDSEARQRMRSRMRPTGRQLRQSTAHSSNNNSNSNWEARIEESTSAESNNPLLLDQSHTAEIRRDSGATASTPSPGSALPSAPLTQPVPLSSLPPISSSSARSIVFSSASRSNSRLASHIVAQLTGATIVSPSTGSEWRSDVSHVVCCNTSSTSRLVKRTMKYMMGVLSGCWVVDWTWLTESAAAGQWLPEDKYEIEGDSIAGATHAARRARKERGRERDRNDLKATHSTPAATRQPPSHPGSLTSSRCSLLSVCCVTVLEPLSPQCPTLHDLTFLIQLAGGKLVLPTLNIATTRTDTHTHTHTHTHAHTHGNTNSKSRVTAAGEKSVAEWVSAVESELPSDCPLVLLCRPSLLDAVAAGECAPLSVLRPLNRLAGGVQLLSISWLLDSIGAYQRMPTSSTYSLTAHINQHNTQSQHNAIAGGE